MKKFLRTSLVCLLLPFGPLAGLVMRPEDIEALIRDMNQQKIVLTVSDKRNNETATNKPVFICQIGNLNGSQNSTRSAPLSADTDLW
jgi:hypothetical protein